MTPHSVSTLPLGGFRCWGHLPKHAAAVQTLLDAGVPPDELPTGGDEEMGEADKDPCINSDNPTTKELITHARIRRAVLSEARSEL